MLAVGDIDETFEKPCNLANGLSAGNACRRRHSRGEQAPASEVGRHHAQPDQQGLATVNPIFTWVRLFQRVPVHIRIKELPDGVRLVAGMTATVEVESRQPSDR